MTTLFGAFRSPQPSPVLPVRIGVGIDTSRYGHYAAFVGPDLQPAADELRFTESADGYGRLRARLERLAVRHHAVDFAIRLDAAGQYADNLLHFLSRLSCDPQNNTCAIPQCTISLSCGDPQRNKNYRVAFFGSQKSDPVEARAAARFALRERPVGVWPLLSSQRALRQVATRLQATVRQRTRLINQHHQLLALTFPELALVIKDISEGWVLELVHRYPTAALLARASADEVGSIPYLPHQHIDTLLGYARSSIASLEDATTTELVRDQIRQLRDTHARQKRLESLFIQAYQGLPRPNHLDTIPGIGAVTAAVLTAFIVDINRFQTPGQLVAYFGVLPIEIGSGVDREGQARSSRHYVMSRRGNDLVRRYLWMASLSAVRCNPAVRALYTRVVAKYPQHKAIAIGHGMRKLLHLVFALCKSDRPFDGGHYPWEKAEPDSTDSPVGIDTPAEQEPTGNQATAGHKPETQSAVSVVTAATAGTVAELEVVDESTFIDFAHLKSQLSMVRVLEHLGLFSRLRGGAGQYRGPCPIHRGDGRGRTLSVNVNSNVFHCFDARCGQQGDIIDLWAALHQSSLRAAALDLVRTFQLEPSRR